MDKRSFERLAVGLITLGAIFLIGICIAYSYSYDFTLTGVIDTKATADFAAYVGGLVGPLWALSGIILFYVALSYQKQDLDIQKKELIKTREEFELARYTDILFRQIAILETTYKAFEFHNTTSYEALNKFMNSFNDMNKIQEYNSGDIGKELEIYGIMRTNLTLINPTYFKNFLMQFSQQLEAFYEIIKESSLDRKNKRQLVQLLGRNLPATLVTILSLIEIIIHNCEDLKKKSAYFDDLEVDERTVENVNKNMEFLRSFQE